MSLSSYQEYQVKRDETSVEVKYHSQARVKKNTYGLYYYLFIGSGIVVK